ncbi:MAG TPA: glycosyltransferase family 87 protein [Pirellulales bacterium]|nr:glycosyltransferase family 87 protein [Pirellulales bacterium]
MYAPSPYAARLFLLFDRDRIRFVALSMVLLALAALGASVLTARQGETIFGPQVGADYATFYLAGAALNADPPARLYDLARQDAAYHGLLPRTPAELSLPFACAPPLAVFARPFAALPYELSYVVWTAFSLVAFRVAFGLFWRQCPGLAPLDFSTSLIAAASFAPFILETVLGGQWQALALLCIAASMELERRGRPLSAGAVLAFCLYKPTLLILILPMLLLTRRWQMLLGGALMTAALTALSWWAVGTQGLIDYGQLLARYVAMRRDAPETIPHLKYVDFMIFLQRIVPHPPAALWWVLAAIGCAAATYLARLAWRVGSLSAECGPSKPLGDRAQGADSDFECARQLAWAAALACTPILSPHCAIYDTIFVIPAILLTANVLALRKCTSDMTTVVPAVPGLTTTFAVLTALVYLTAWFTQPLAGICHVQALTLALAALGIYIACLARQLLSESTRAFPCHS